MRARRTSPADIATAGVVLVLALAIAQSARHRETERVPLLRAQVAPERELPAAERLFAADDRVALAAAREIAGAASDPAPFLTFAERRRFRVDALDALEDAGDPGALEALVRLMDHDDERVAARAVLGAARLGGRDAAAHVTRLLGRPAADVPDDALRAAVELRDPAVARLLRRLVLDAPAAKRDTALSALARIGDERAAQALRTGSGDGDAWDRLRIAESMVRAEMPGANRAWSEALRDLSAPDRAAAVRALRGPVPAAIVAALRDLDPDATPDLRREIRRTLARAATPLDGTAVRVRVAASVTSYETR